ncbi:CYTH domain-containing protein [Winogradskyella sp. SYSU M77433]|uniref:CYTH domain-containing protein n=1 Tax=Winogradskyella sp. SYSU M77433 TaxID=3042722 RepID=UPI0024803803|nr:CYTH domain-containing protein [Winogradskyella sp. SYSU M77433]MDH7913866.1 CYTH domain-containing protein [Winogradskyella sp. SYSU M77433]|tara:strand:- start:659 stop:1135 length:477 start_codon:yes stop_codon:yes gene_type:complete
MAVEIERKFLVNSLAFKQEAFNSYVIKQGFLNSHKERTVRVRLIEDKGFLTVKGKSSNDGLSRFEWEKEISISEAESLLMLCEEGVIDKTRYEVRVDKHTFEVDEFHGENEGLILAEVELHSENEEFTNPKWLAREVTGDVRYYNSQLSKTPYNLWKN